MVNIPLLSVCVHAPLDLIVTDAPSIGVPLEASVTFPVIFCCAKSDCMQSKSTIVLSNFIRLIRQVYELKLKNYFLIKFEDGFICAYMLKMLVSSATVLRYNIG